MIFPHLSVPAKSPSARQFAGFLLKIPVCDTEVHFLLCKDTYPGKVYTALMIGYPHTSGNLTDIVPTNFPYWNVCFNLLPLVLNFCWSSVLLFYRRNQTLHIFASLFQGKFALFIPPWRYELFGIFHPFDTLEHISGKQMRKFSEKYL